MLVATKKDCTDMLLKLRGELSKARYYDVTKAAIRECFSKTGFVKNPDCGIDGVYKRDLQLAHLHT